MRIRSYSEMKQFDSLIDRFNYLALKGRVGDKTFGFDRYINQMFYRSTQWRNIRHHIIARDLGCDLGVDGYEIYHGLYIHHMNPLTANDIVNGDESIFDPEFLITTTLNTHNAIHYGDDKLLTKILVERKPGDTKLW
jgi:hypothetical protein